jgi:hypothetical protein
MLGIPRLVEPLAASQAGLRSMAMFSLIGLRHPEALRGSYHCDVWGSNGGVDFTSLWYMTPCSLVDRYQCFWGTFRLHLQCRRVRGEWKVRATLRRGITKRTEAIFSAKHSLCYSPDHIGSFRAPAPHPHLLVSLPTFLAFFYPEDEFSKCLWNDTNHPRAVTYNLWKYNTNGIRLPRLCD